MNAFVAPTDPEWYHFLRDVHARAPLEEVNFWLPKPWGGRFRVLGDGQPLLFKLKRPFNAIAGGGFFKHYTELPLSIAWDSFGESNGAATHSDVWRLITHLRREHPQPWDDPVIGCVLLVEPFFWPKELWIHDPPGWHRNIQRGRTYDLREGEGRWLWEAVRERLHHALPAPPVHTREGAEHATIPAAGYGDPILQPRRLGQGTFSAIVRDVYHRQCAVTSEKALPALDAAHIVSYAERPVHEVRNGILLRSDVHRLFDKGYLTITPEHRVEASRRMKDDFDDGESYLRLHGRRVRVTDDPLLRPDPEALRWHNEKRFRG